MADISYCNIDDRECPLACTCKRWINNRDTNDKYYSVASFKPVIVNGETTCDYYIEFINYYKNKLGD